MVCRTRENSRRDASVRSGRRRRSQGSFHLVRRHVEHFVAGRQMNFAAIDIGILLPALLAGLLVLATHVPLGMQVLSRGIVFIDLAIAQIAGLGVIIADMMGWAPQGVGGQAAALLMALGGALLLTWTERR